MLFNSLDFVVLVLLTMGLFYCGPLRRLQTGILILASSVFYAYGQPVLLLLLYASIAINAVTSHRIARARDTARRKAWALGGVAANLAVLGTFKYGPLAASVFGVGEGNSLGNWLLHVPLPIGISFYTFQGISLVIDTFREVERPGEAAAETRGFWRHAVDCTLFVGFFPQLVAGPIVKAHDFMPQIRAKRLADVPWEEAVRCLIAGYFLKMVVADNLSDLTGILVYPHFRTASSSMLLAALFGFSCQIFADFAGYSLIAIGVAALFGYRLRPNFMFPYISRSLSEFWRRWHISLSSWLKEYLYFPLGGNRRGPARTYFNLLIVMVLGGLWHGAGWNYALWGFYHGLGLAVERALGRPETKEGSAPGIWRCVVIFVFVSFGWLLFKLSSLTEMGMFLHALCTQWAYPEGAYFFAYVLVYSLPVIVYHALYLLRESGRLVLPDLARNVLLGGALAAIVLCAGPPGEFIYFQF